MNCVAECEYCKSINVLIDGESGSIAGHFCKKLNRLVQINKPVEEDCPFYFKGYSYRDLVELQERILKNINNYRYQKFPTISYNIPTVTVIGIIRKEFDSILNKDKNGN